MGSKKYSLAIEKIEEVVDEFKVENQTYLFNVQNCNQGKLVKIKIRHGLKEEEGILNCYISGGQVSFSIQGKKQLYGICNRCQSYIVEHTSIPQIDQKCFTLKNIDETDFDALIDTIRESVKIISKTVNQNIRNHYYLEGKYGARISVIFYKNGTLVVQGSLTSFYVKFIIDVLTSISNVPSEAINELFSIRPRLGYVIDTDLSKHISNLEQIRGTIIEKYIMTSIYLANSGVKVDDYGCYTFGILKALDALLTKCILENSSEFDNYGTYFEKEHNSNDKYRFIDGVITYNDNISLKYALEDGYTFFHRHRHTTFHIDKTAIETSRILDYDKAIEIIKDSLVIINRICKNW